MNKAKFLTINVLMFLILVATVSLGVLIGCNTNKQEPLPSVIIEFEADGSYPMYPLEYNGDIAINNIQMSYLTSYSPYKPDNVFWGWTYDGKYIEEYDISVFRVPGKYKLIAQWRKVDTLEDSHVKQAIKSCFAESDNVYIKQDRFGYFATINMVGGSFDKWYNCGINAIDNLNSFKNLYSQYDKLVSGFDIFYREGDNFCCSINYKNSVGTQVDKLTDFKDSSYNPVSLLTKQEYENAKQILESND